MVDAVEEDFQLRLILNKPGHQRSYDDLLLLRSRISQMDLLKSTFAGLHPRQVDELCRSLGIETFNHDVVVFNQGDEGDKFYIVLTGACTIKVKNLIVDEISGESEVREKTLFTCNPGQHFGERALEFNEPRAASVVTAAYTELLTVTRNAYTKILKAYEEESGLMKLDSDNKASIVRVLSKSRDKRNEAELLAVAAFLERRNHFFQKFTSDQRLELTRVSELISIYGRTTLFKQGSIGQAFYVILSGTVDVYVNTVDTDSSTKTGADGLLVNTLVSGASFGERALESESSQRTASVLTCEGLTELLVIAREDYNTIVTIMLQEELAEKCALLRRTLLFKDVPFPVLKEFSKYMESRIFHIDSYITVAGKKAFDIVIIKEGECQVEMESSHYSNLMDNSEVAIEPWDGKSRPKSPKSGGYQQQLNISKHVKTETISLGRVGPAAVLSTDITQLRGIYAEAFHRETIQATTIVSAYVLAKNDYFHHLAANARTLITQLVADYRPPHLSNMWDAGPFPMGEDEWRSRKAWKSFREDIMSGKKSTNILDNHKKALTLSMSDKDGNKPKKDTQEENSALYLNAKAMVALTRQELEQRKKNERIAENEKRIALEREEIKRFTPLTQKEVQAMQNRHRIAHQLGRSEDDDLDSIQQKKTKIPSTAPKGRSVLLSRDATVNATYKYPFSVIHIHREKIKLRAGTGSRRLLKCYLRLCGVTQSCGEAIKSAEALMLNAFMTMLNSNIERADEVFLNWKPFVGFECMPLHHTDHFLIYCRTAPMQYACISPKENLLNFVYPSVCKFKGQRYATVSTKYLVDITKPVKLPRKEPAVKSTYKVKLKDKETVTESIAPVKRQLSRRGSVNMRSSRHLFIGGRPSSPATEEEESDEDSTKDTEEDDEELKYATAAEQVAQPLFLKEVGILGEVHQCSGAPSEALKYAHFHGHIVGAMAEQRISNKHVPQVPPKKGTAAAAVTLPSVHDTSAAPIPPKQRICVLPMYQWIEISDTVLSHYDRERLTDANVDTETNPNNIPANVNRRFDSNGNLISVVDESPTKQAVGRLASSTAQAVSQLTEAFSEAGLPMCFGKSNVGVTGKGFKEGNVGSGAVIKNGLGTSGSVKDPNANSNNDNIMITDNISIKVLNDEVERKKLYEEITAGVSAQMSQNDHGFVNNLNSAMHLLSQSQPHVVPISSAIAAKNNAILNANATANVGEETVPTIGSPVANDASGHHKHHHPPKTEKTNVEKFQKPGLHKQISFSGFTDNYMMVKGGEDKSSSISSLKPIEEHRESSVTSAVPENSGSVKPINATGSGGANAITTSTTTATNTTTGEIPQFQVSAGISTLPQVSLYQVKGAMLKQRNHEVQEAAVAAIKESASKIEDKMDALRFVTESRRKVIELHDGICDSEKEISSKIHCLKHGKSIKHSSGRYHSPKPSNSNTRRNSANSAASVLTMNSSFNASSDTSPVASSLMNMSMKPNNINTQDAIIDFKACSADGVSDSSGSEDEDGFRNQYQKTTTKTNPPNKFMGRQTSSAMIIEAMSNMGSATIVDTTSVAEGTNQSGTSQNFNYNNKMKKQIDKSKKRVIGQRMDLLENLMKLPATKTIENELRTKRYVQVRKEKEKEMSKSLDTSTSMHKSHSTSAIKDKPTGSSLSMKLDVLETMLNKRNGITLMHPSVVEDLAFVENVIPLSRDQLGLEEAEVLCNTGE